MFALKFNYLINARQDCFDDEHCGVFIPAKKDFSFNYCDLTLKIDETLKNGRINICTITISIVSIRSFHMFLLTYNPPSTLLYRTAANFLTDWNSS